MKRRRFQLSSWKGKIWVTPIQLTHTDKTGGRQIFSKYARVSVDITEGESHGKNANFINE